MATSRFDRFRRPSLPAGVEAGLHLARGERVLSFAPLPSVHGQPGGFAVATDRALLLPVGSGWRSIGWHEVTGAAWDSDHDELVLTVLSATGPETLVVDVPADTVSTLPEVVRERVQSSIVVSRHVTLRGGAGVRLVGRRVAGVDDLTWQAVLDGGLDPRDPGIAADAAAALEALRRETAP